jgi:branched-chain amino acid transport system permease protein
LFGYTQTSAPATGPKLALVLITQLLISMAVAGVTAIFVEYVAYRRLRAKGTNRLATLISAICI